MQNDDTTRYNNLIQPADAIEMLKADHRRVRTLFQRYDETDEQAMKRGIIVELFVELELHTQLEETVFYPAFADETNREARVGRASLEAHEDIDVLVEELGASRPIKRRLRRSSKSCAPKWNSMQDEESQMFPQAEQELQEQLEDLRDEMQEIKEQLLAHCSRVPCARYSGDRPHDPRTYQGHCIGVEYQRQRCQKRWFCPPG